MKLEKIVKKARMLARPHRVEDGKKFRLDDVDPGDIGHLEAEDTGRALLAEK